MIKAISGALTLLLMIVVMRATLPEVADLLTQIIVTSLTIVNNVLNVVNSRPI